MKLINSLISFLEDNRDEIIDISNNLTNIDPFYIGSKKVCKENFFCRCSILDDEFLLIMSKYKFSIAISGEKFLILTDNNNNIDQHKMEQFINGDLTDNYIILSSNAPNILLGDDQ